MKLLLDQNLSHRILPAIEALFPEPRHVKDLGMSEADDTSIWNLAIREGFAILSKDSDFLYRSLPLLDSRPLAQIRDHKKSRPLRSCSEVTPLVRLWRRRK